ncbi:hypothetical protein DFQ26_002776, partial [Actinomortierella ambigua]
SKLAIAPPAPIATKLGRKPNAYRPSLGHGLQQQLKAKVFRFDRPRQVVPPSSKAEDWDQQSQPETLEPVPPRKRKRRRQQSEAQKQEAQKKRQEKKDEEKKRKKVKDMGPDAPKAEKGKSRNLKPSTRESKRLAGSVHTRALPLGTTRRCLQDNAVANRLLTQVQADDVLHRMHQCTVMVNLLVQRLFWATALL